MQAFDPKQPSEEYFLGFNFTENFDDDEDIASAAIVIIDTADDSDVTTTLSDVGNQVNNGKISYVWIQGGTTGHKYKITCVVTGDAVPPSIFELDAYIKVREI